MGRNFFPSRSCTEFSIWASAVRRLPTAETAVASPDSLGPLGHMVAAAPQAADASPRPHEGLSKKNFRTYSKFFRDTEPYEVALDEVLWQLAKQQLLRGGSTHTVHAWSIGCSAGEEAYSVLLAWEQLIRPQLLPASVGLRYHGTDCSRAAVDAAQRAEFSSHAVQDVPPAWLRACFTAHDASGTEISETPLPLAGGGGGVARLGSTEESAGRGRQGSSLSWRLCDEVRQLAAWEVQDVREAVPSRRFDLISCRYSVFLYLTLAEAEQVLQNIVMNCLAPGAPPSPRPGLPIPLGSCHPLPYCCARGLTG
jgi:chemotaxis methyl-accepting protein methylase